MLDHLDVAADGQRGVVAAAVKRGEEDAELHAAVGHVIAPSMVLSWGEAAGKGRVWMR